MTNKSFGYLSYTLKNILKLEDGEKYPYVVSLFDLELIVDRIQDAETLIDYISQRIELYSRLIISDELDAVAYYIKYSSLDFGEGSKDADELFLDPTLSNLFDNDFLRKHGHPLKEEDEGREGPYFTYIKKDAGQIEVGIKNKFGETLEHDIFSIPITGQTENQEIEKAQHLSMKGKDRNKPCSCNSGKKYKNCCGRN